MANPPSEHYVDPSINSDTGNGLIGTPYGDLQYALNREGTDYTQDTTNGDRFNIKASGTELLTAALDLTAYGTPSYSYPLIFQGYETTQGDRGVGVINCNAFAAITNAGTGINWYDMELYGGPATSAIITMAQYSCVAQCYIHDSDGYGVLFGTNDSGVVGCRFEDLGGSAYEMISLGTSQSRIINSYFKQGAGRVCKSAIYNSNIGNIIANNIISIRSISNGIRDNAFSSTITGNTVFNSDGTGTGEGISVYHSNGPINIALLNNYVEGFNGTNGVGIEITGTSTGSGIHGQNALYANATNYSVSAETHLELGDNETLGSSGIAKSGSDTFANRFNYFAPLDVGNMQTGGFPEA